MKLTSNKLQDSEWTEILNEFDADDVKEHLKLISNQFIKQIMAIETKKKRSKSPSPNQLRP